MKHSLDLDFIQRDVGLRKLDQQGRGKDDREFWIVNFVLHLFIFYFDFTL